MAYDSWFMSQESWVGSDESRVTLMRINYHTLCWVLLRVDANETGHNVLASLFLIWRSVALVMAVLMSHVPWVMSHVPWVMSHVPRVMTHVGSNKLWHYVLVSPFLLCVHVSESWFVSEVWHYVLPCFSSGDLLPLRLQCLGVMSHESRGMLMWMRHVTFCWLPCILCGDFSLSLSLSHTHAHTRTHTHTHTHTHAHSLSLSPHTRGHVLIHSRSLTHARMHAHAHARARSLSLSLSFSLSLPVTLLFVARQPHIHTHTHTHMYAHIHIHTY